MKKVFLYIFVGFIMIGCASKDINITSSSQAKTSPYIKNILKEYMAVKKNPIYSKKVPMQLYKATKIAKALVNENNSILKNHYAYLLKNQVRVVKLSKKKLDMIDRLNKIIIKRNQAIEDAKHQDDEDADEVESIDDNNQDMLDNSGDIKSLFNFDGSSWTVDGKYFDGDEIIYKKELKALIAYLASFLEKNEDKIVVMESFTDGVGSQSYSLDMAKSRANMLKEKLVDRGIDESRIKIDAKGAVGFIGSNDTKEGREKNNRIVIKIK